MTSLEEKVSNLPKKRRSSVSYVCPEEGCNLTFSKSSKLKLHASKHSGERPFICEYDDCLASFKRVDHLKRHERTKHEGIERCKCTFEGCTSEFVSKHSFQKHLKRKHNSERTVFKCNVCKKEFLKHQHLKVHEFSHTQIKSFVCSHEGCDKSFVMPSQLKRHMKCHKVYKCDQSDCSEEFPRWSAYRAHKKQFHPTVHTCSNCGKSFLSKYNLRQHKLIHKEIQKSFKCTHDGCGREYIVKKNLQQHIRNHHAEAHFNCTQEGCDKKYQHKVSLLKHLKEHEPNFNHPVKKATKKLYTYYKRKTAAAILSTYKPSLNEERSILKKDKLFVAKTYSETRKEIDTALMDVAKTIQ